MEESSYNQANIGYVKILENGYACYSPITQSHITNMSANEIPQTWDFWWNIDRLFIDWADEVWVMIPEEGIDAVVSSRGVTDEVIYATDRLKEVKYFTITKGGSIEFSNIEDYFVFGNNVIED